jgi:hypothetical protein
MILPKTIMEKTIIARKYCPFLLLLMSFYYVSGQTSKQEIFNTPEKTGGVYYAYPVKTKINQTTPPKGYKPFYISHLGRHGSRYLVNDVDYKSVIDIFEDAHKENALTPWGIDVHERLNKIWLEAEGHGGDLSPLGVRQQRGIAERMYQSFPEVFTNNTKISARSTTVIRCVLSMDAFCERLKELNPTLQTTREASNKYINYLNFHTKEAVTFRSSKDTWREDYQKFEESHIHPKRLVNSLFSDLKYIENKLNSKSLMLGLYEIAGGMQNIETPLSLYDVFEKEELFDLWQCRNYRLYVEYANASKNGGIMMENAKPLLKNILNNANEAILSKAKGSSFRFAHDGNIIPLTMLLHLQNCYNSVSEPLEYYKAWSDFKVAPMAGNVQIIFFRKQNSGDILVKFLLNEQETLIPTLKTNIAPYYKWKDLEAYYKLLLGNQ